MISFFLFFISVCYAYQISIGNHHACAIVEKCEIKCWGTGGYWLGNPRIGNQSVGWQDDEFAWKQHMVPLDSVGVVPTPAFEAIHVAVGSQFSCAIFSEPGVPVPTVRCWGEGRRGQLGVPVVVAASPAAPVTLAAAAGHPISLCAGASHACALTDAGQLYCWGSNESGQLGYNTSTLAYGTNNALDPSLNAPKAWRLPAEVGPVPLNGRRVSSVSCGARHTCVVSELGLVRCFGYNDERLGAVDPGDAGLKPRSVSSQKAVELKPPLDGSSAVQVSAELASTCVRYASGKIACFGHTLAGELGFSLLPSQVDLELARESGGDNWHQDLRIEAYVNADRALEFSVPLPSQTTLFEGRRTTDSERFARTQDALSDPVVDLCSGGRGHCALTRAGRLYCWGSSPGIEPPLVTNVDGDSGSQLLAAQTKARYTVREMSVVNGSPVPISMCAMGPLGLCAVLKSSGAVRCAGLVTNGFYGQRPTPANATRAPGLPATDIEGLSMSISAGRVRVCCPEGRFGQHCDCLTPPPPYPASCVGGSWLVSEPVSGVEVGSYTVPVIGGTVVDDEVVFQPGGGFNVSGVGCLRFGANARLRYKTDVPLSPGERIRLVDGCVESKPATVDITPLPDDECDNKYQTETFVDAMSAGVPGGLWFRVTRSHCLFPSQPWHYVVLFGAVLLLVAAIIGLSVRVVRLAQRWRRRHHQHRQSQCRQEQQFVQPVEEQPSVQLYTAELQRPGDGRPESSSGDRSSQIYSNLVLSDAFGSTATRATDLVMARSYGEVPPTNDRAYDKMHCPPVGEYNFDSSHSAKSSPRRRKSGRSRQHSTSNNKTKTSVAKLGNSQLLSLPDEGDDDAVPPKYDPGSSIVRKTVSVPPKLPSKTRSSGAIHSQQQQQPKSTGNLPVASRKPPASFVKSLSTTELKI